jgi:DNA polymerase IV (DinB-like DNA polymerase)
MIILHVDMDSFFSSIEVRENPSLKGKPVVVGADPKGGKGRGVVSTCSYEAREYGIRSGMPISRAYRLCPNAVFLPVNMSLYRRVSARIMKRLRKHADRFEQVSVDEAYLDVSDKARDYKRAEKLALRIKKEILKKEKLTCSIGIAPNKSIAKIASDFEKPNGLTIVRPGEVEDFLAPLPVRKISGIGGKTEEVLEEMGIKTIGQLARCDEQKLLDRFGKVGLQFHLLARGIDEREVKEVRVAKSVGKEVTFEKDTSDPGVLNETIDDLAEKAYDALGERFFRTVTLRVRFEDFETHTRARTLETPVHNLETVKEISKELLKGFLGEKKIRLLGVRLSKLRTRDEAQRLVEEFAG